MALLLAALGDVARAVKDDDVFGTTDDVAIDPADYDCLQFKDIFAGGEEMCNTVWGSSFKYEPNETIGYTWWYFDQDESPNDAATLARGLSVPDTCDVTYFHKSAPSPEGDDFTECHPWKNNACCHEVSRRRRSPAPVSLSPSYDTRILCLSIRRRLPPYLSVLPPRPPPPPPLSAAREATVTTPYYMNTVYGPGYRWDRCGKLSEACERFFVAEACFYECDVNAGHFRTFSDAEVAACTDDWCADNTWSVTGIPIKASYCESFYSACRNDYFHSSGDYWTAYSAYEEAYQAAYEEAQAAKAKKDKKKKDPGMLIMIVAIVLGLLTLVLAAVACSLTAKVKKYEELGGGVGVQDARAAGGGKI